MTFLWAARVLVAVMALTVLTACASALVKHAFSFDTSEDRGVEILDYRYGDSRQPGARANPQDLAHGRRIAQSVNIIGEIRRPDELYVRWRDLRTDKTYEDTVDLKRLLPRDITDNRIHFTVRGPQLFVYLITTQRRRPEEPAIGPVETRYRKTIILAADYGHEIALK